MERGPMYNRDEVVEFALRQVIEGGMKPTHAARMAVDKFKRYTPCYICDFVTKHPRYKEFRCGKPADPGIIPMEVLEGVHKIVTENPKMPIMTCIQKYKEESGCQFPDESIRGKYRRVMGGADGVKRGRYKTGLDSSDCLLDLSLDELVRRGYLSRAKE